MKAMGIAIFGSYGRIGLKLLCNEGTSVATSRSCEWYKLALVQAILGLLVSYIQTYKEGEDNNELMILRFDVLINF